MSTATNTVNPRPAASSVRPRRPPVLQSMQVIVGDIFGRVRLGARRGKPRGDREKTMAQVEVAQMAPCTDSITVPSPCVEDKSVVLTAPPSPNSIPAPLPCIEDKSVAQMPPSPNSIPAPLPCIEDKSVVLTAPPSPNSIPVPLPCIEDKSTPHCDPIIQQQINPRPLSPISEVVSLHDDASRSSPALVLPLPDELLSNIFIHCLPCISSPRDIQYGSHVIDPLHPHPHAVRRALTQVCRSWRTVATNTPTLWTTIVLGRALKWDVDNLENWLRHSRSCPLDILIRPTNWSGSKARATPLLRPLRNETGRIRSFMAMHIHSEELLEMFPLDSSHITQMVSLEVFYIREFSKSPMAPEEDDLNFSLDFSMGLVYTPKLQYLELAEATLVTSFMTTSFIPLQRMVLSASKYPVPYSTYLQFLTCCPNLSSLWFFSQGPVNFNGLIPMWPETRHSLPALHDLRFYANHTPETMLFLRSLHLPSLLRLRFGQYETARHPTDLVLQVFWHLFAETASTLEYVQLGHGSLPIGDNLAGPLLRNMTNLRTLVICDVSLKPDVLECLIPEPGTPLDQWPCPRLAFLTLYSVDIEGDALPRLISARPPLSLQERDRVYRDSLGNKQQKQLQQQEGGDGHSKGEAHHKTVVVDGEEHDRIHPKMWDDAASVRTASQHYTTNGRLVFIGIFHCCVLEERTMAALVDLERVHGDVIDFRR